ncbi:MAG: hypothetical protein U1E53_27505 [Dongiaceae bacterium]
MGRPAATPRRRLSSTMRAAWGGGARRSIEWALAWRLGLLFIAVFAAAGAMVEARFRAGDLEVPSRLVQQHLRDVIRAVRPGPAGALEFNLGKGPRKYSYLVRETGGAVLFASAPPMAPRLAAVPAEWDASFFRSAEPDRKAMLFGAHQRIRVGGRDLVVQVAERDSDWKLEKRSFGDELLGDMMPVMLPFALATLLIGVVTIRRGCGR